MTKRIDCYFDYVSPFSYLLHEQLHRLPDQVNINFVPVLFAGFLKHWGHLGPVEIESKRLFTYRHSAWIAAKLNVDFVMPKSHPFNPLPYLRLTIALDNDPEIITKIFRAIWTLNLDPASIEGRQRVWRKLGAENVDSKISNPEVKNKLFENTRTAIEKGVFGVPTMMVENQLFWGLDSLDLLLEFLENEDLFQTENMKQLESVPTGVVART